MAAKDTVYASGKVAAGSTAGKGGKVQVTGERVALIQAEVDVSGKSGGGTVLVGGDYLGKNPDVPNAKAVVMTSDSVIRANATENGDGGKVILWSDEYTGFYGEIFARGGIESGNGGFVETSSKDNLQAFGTVIASAVNGQGGLWLLDPANVDIALADLNGSFDSGTPNVFTPNNTGSATVNRTTIQNSLNAGTSVTIQTGVSSAGQAGNITMSAAISKDATVTGTASTLTMIAAGSINISQAIGSVDGGLTLVLGAQSGVTIGANITTLGGNLTIQGAAADGASLAASTTSVTINSGTVSTLGGSGSGNFSVAATGAVNQAGGTLLIKGTSSITTGAATITLAQAANDFTGAVSLSTTGANPVQITDQNALTLGTLNIGGALTALANGALNLGQGSVGGVLTANSFNGAVGASGAITQAGALTVSSTSSLTAGANAITLTQPLNDFTLAVSLSTTGANPVQITDQNALTLGTLNIGGALTALANGALNLGQGSVGGVLTANSFNGAVGASGAITQAGALTVSSTSSLTAGANAITLTQPLNDFTLAVSLNNSGANNNVELTDINGLILGASTFGGDFTATSIPGSTDPGTITVSGALLKSGGASEATLTLNAGTTGASGGGNIIINNTIISNTGALNVFLNASQGSITLGNFVVTTLGGSVTMRGGLGITQGTGAITTAGGDLFYYGSLNLAGAATISTGGGDILFNAAVNGAQALNVAAGTGNILFVGDVGDGTRLGAITINSAANVDFVKTVTAASLTQSAGTGTTTFSGAQNYNTINGLSVVTDTIVLNSSVTTSSSGTVTLNANDNNVAAGSGTLTIASAGDITSDGAVNLTGTSGITTAGDVTTTGDVVNYNSATTLTGNISTATSGAPIIFNSTLNGPFASTLNAGAAGNILFRGVIGGVTPLNSLSLTDAAGATLLGATTLNDQNYVVPITFLSSEPASFVSTSGKINFDFGLESLATTQALTISAVNGTVTFGSSLGSIITFCLGFCHGRDIDYYSEHHNTGWRHYFDWSCNSFRFVSL